MKSPYSGVMKFSYLFLSLLLSGLLAVLFLFGTERALASGPRDGPSPGSAAPLAALQGDGNHSASGRTISAATTDGPSGNATLVSLTLTSEGGPILLSPPFDPNITFYYTTVEAEAVLVDATTAKDTASIVSYTVGDKTEVPESEEGKLATRLQLLEGAVTDFSLTVKAEDGATLETYHVLFSRPARQSLPEITILASRGVYVVGWGGLSFTLTRTGDLSDGLTANVNFAQTENWLLETSHAAVFAPGSATAGIAFAPTAFSMDITENGFLNASVASVTGYDTSSARARVLVGSIQGPAITVSFEDAEFTVQEDAGDFSAMLVAQAAPGLPYVEEFAVTVSTESLEAAPPLDYAALSQQLVFLPADFQDEDGSLVARSEVMLTIVDDTLSEGEERFGLELARAPSTPPKIGLLDPDGAQCDIICDNHYLVTIIDNDIALGIRLSVSSDRIHESGPTASTITVSTDNGEAFPSSQTITVNFGGPAVYGDDYTVSPDDADDGADGHQVVVTSGAASTALTVTAVDDTDVESCEWLEVSLANAEDSSSPEVAVIAVQDDDGSPDSVTPLALGLSGILTGNLTEGDAGQDWYSFEATGGVKYIIEVKHPLTFSAMEGSFGNAAQVPGYLVDPSILEIIDDTDAPVLGEHDQGGFTLNFARAFFTPDRTGTYRIKVGAGEQDRSGVGCYTITVRADDHADDYRTEPGIVLRPGAYIIASIDSDVAQNDTGLNFWDWNSNPNPGPDDDSGNHFRPRRGIESLDDRDVFRYEIAEAGMYRLALLVQPTGVGIWYVWDHQGNLWTEAEVAPVGVIERYHEPGTYYAEVGTPYQSEGNTGTYMLTLGAVGNDCGLG